MPQCCEPELQMAVFNELRDAETLTLERARHVEGCAACQMAIERLRRMIAVWTADQMDERAMVAAAVSFHPRCVANRVATPWLEVAPFGAAGVAAGYLLLAVMGTIILPWKSRPSIDALRSNEPHAVALSFPNGAKENSPRVAPAMALREDDLDAADSAFEELCHSADPATRDAARLARAQLWISRGRETSVRPVLEQLAQSGATTLVRQRAAEFLKRDNP